MWVWGEEAGLAAGCQVHLEGPSVGRWVYCLPSDIGSWLERRKEGGGRREERSEKTSWESGKIYEFHRLQGVVFRSSWRGEVEVEVEEGGMGALE